MSAWRKAGFSYVLLYWLKLERSCPIELCKLNTNPTSRFNKYLQISAQTVRKALKPEFQTQKVQARGNTDAKVIKFENGVAKEAEPLAKH